MGNDNRCDTCRFFETENGAFGECHRYPPLGPRMMPHNDGMQYVTSHRPNVSFAEWCGEWRGVEKAGE